jgi:hypothetical protein
VLPIGQGGAHRSRSAVADAVGALVADVLIMFAEVPQARRPMTKERDLRHQRPVFVLQVVPQFGRYPRRADRAGIPTPRRVIEGVLEPPLRGASYLNWFASTNRNIDWPLWRCIRAGGCTIASRYGVAMLMVIRMVSIFCDFNQGSQHLHVFNTYEATRCPASAVCSARPAWTSYHSFGTF